MEFLRNLTDTQKGILLMITGIILLLHTLGIVKKGLDTIIIITSIVMIVIGFVRAKYHTKILVLIQRQ